MDASDALTNFGFTHIEALVYAELLQSHPATGYKLSKALGKAPANIYQALKALVEKGAVATTGDKGGAPAYIPVPPVQLMAAIRRTFEERHDQALGCLEHVVSPPDEESVYQLRTVTQVQERVRAMLALASGYALFDMFPAVLDLFAPEIAAARDRGVTVAGIAYRPQDAGALMPYNGESSDLVGRRWPGQGLILVTDAREHLIAQLSRDMNKVLSAVYSDSVLISCVMHSALAADMRLVSLREDGTDRLSRLSLQRADPEGMRILAKTYS